MSEQEGPQFGDFLLARRALPIVRTLYPRGFPLELATNSEAVLAAAEEIWGRNCPEFDRPPLRIHVLVEAGEKGPGRPPVYRLQLGLMSIVCDQGHFGCCDLGSRFGWCQVSAAALEDRAWFRWHFLEAMAYSLLNSQDVVTVHAACVGRDGRGVLLCGPSGSGKSSLAFACAREGWTYLADDATMLLQCSPQREAVGRPQRFQLRPEAAALFPELEGMPVTVRPNLKPAIEVSTEALGLAGTFRCSIGTVVFLKRQDGESRLRSIEPIEALSRLMREMPDYGGAVRERHEQTLRSLVQVPIYEAQYADFRQALEMLSVLDR
jgi:hypothetical protein